MLAQRFGDAGLPFVGRQVDPRATVLARGGLRGDQLAKKLSVNKVAHRARYFYPSITKFHGPASSYTCLDYDDAIVPQPQVCDK